MASNEEPREAPAVRSRAGTRQQLLQDRSFNSKCQATLNCVVAGLHPVGDAISSAVQRVAQATPSGKTVWDTLNKPFIAANLGNFGGVGAQNMAVTAWAHWMWPATPVTVTHTQLQTLYTTVTAPSTDPTPSPGACDANGNGNALLTDVVDFMTSKFGTAAAWQANVPVPGGSTLYLSVNTQSNGQAMDNSDRCGAPGMST